MGNILMFFAVKVPDNTWITTKTLAVMLGPMIFHSFTNVGGG